METTIYMRSSELTPDAFDKIQQWITDKENADITITIKEPYFDFERYCSDYAKEEEPFEGAA